MNDVILFPLKTERHGPALVRESNIMMAIYKAENKALAEALWGINMLLRDGFTDTIEEPLLSRLERWWGLSSSENTTIEDRRLAIIAKMAARTIYTKRSLYRMLEALCGVNGFILEIDEARYFVKVLVALRSKHQAEIVKGLLRAVLPANMLYEVDLMYNTHAVLGKLTHTELAKYTHKELRSSAAVRAESEAKG